MSEGQKAGLEPHLSRGQAGEGRGPGAHQISWNGTFLPLAAGPHRWTDLRGGSDAHLPASDDKQGNGASPRQSSLAGCLKPRASRRIPNFRNQTGTCLTKINPAPNIYFYRDFAAVEAGRSTRATGRCACCPPGQSPRLPTGGPCWRSWQGPQKGVFWEKSILLLAQGRSARVFSLSNINSGLQNPSKFLFHTDKQALQRRDSSRKGQKSTWWT